MRNTGQAERCCSIDLYISTLWPLDFNKCFRDKLVQSGSLWVHKVGWNLWEIKRKLTLNIVPGICTGVLVISFVSLWIGGLSPHYQIATCRLFNPQLSRCQSYLECRIPSHQPNLLWVSLHHMLLIENPQGTDSGG